MAKQKMRYDEKEISLLKSIFADNDQILYVLRKVFLQAELSELDLKVLKSITQSKEAQALLRKTYAPEIELDSPFGQLVDLWLSTDTAGKTPAEVKLALRVRERLLEMVNDGLRRLETNNHKPVGDILGYAPDTSKEDEELYVELMARNNLITHTEFQLNQIKILGERKEETLEELTKRLAKDSAK